MDQLTEAKGTEITEAESKEAEITAGETQTAEITEAETKETEVMEAETKEAEVLEAETKKAEAGEDGKRIIVVCFSRDRSAFSWFTFFTDGGGLTHASIAFDEDSDHYYSFNFKGFKREYRTSLKKRPREMKRYKIAVTEAEYQSLKGLLTKMEAEKGRYSYASLGVSLCLFKIPNFTGTGQMFCSQFVAKVLDESGCVPISKHYGNITPNMLIKELEQSGKVVEIDDDSNLKTFADIAVDHVVGWVEKVRNGVLSITSTKRKKAQSKWNYMPLFVVHASIDTSNKFERVYRAAFSAGKETKKIANKVPQDLAQQTGNFVKMTTGQLSRLLPK